MPPRENPSYQGDVCPSYQEEQWVQDEREQVATATRAEERLFQQMDAGSVGVSSYRMMACSRGRVLS